MKSYTEREIRDLMTPKDVPQPPEGLADLVKSEIPDHFDLRPAEEDEAPPKVVPFVRRRRLRTYALAASLAVTVGGALLVHRARQEAMAPDVVMAAAEVGVDIMPSPLVEMETPAVSVPQTSKASLDKQVTEKLQALGYVDSAADDTPRADRAKGRESLREAPGSGGERSRRDARVSGAGASEVSPLPATPAPAARSRPAASVPTASSVPTALPRTSAPADTNAQQLRPPAASFDQETDAREQVEEAREMSRQLMPARENLAAREGLRRVEGKEAEGVLQSRLSTYRASTMKSPITPAPRPANPNAAPFDDVYFRGYGTNPFIDTEDDALSTFGLDVDTASYAVLRRFLRDGHLPPPDAVRVEELVNYFDYGDAPPERGDFAIYAEGAPSPFGEGERYHLVRFHLRGRDLGAQERRPADLTFVIDISGSMARQNRLGLVRESLLLLTDHLREDDRIALVVYGSRGRVVLEHTSDRERIRSALAALQPEGSTNAEEGLQLGYTLAAQVHRRGTTNRVILCSDGVANVGNTSADSILRQVTALGRRGIELTTVGFGMGNYNDVLMEQLADRGNGRYAYVDTLDEARRLFVDNLTGTLQTIAAEARAQVQFNPQAVSRYRLVGYENRDIADSRFRDDAVDAGEIGAGHAVTALYEVKLREPLKQRDEIATLRLRYGSILSGEMTETSRRVTGKDVARTWEESTPALRLTSLVAEFGEIMKESYWARTGDLDDVFRRAQSVAIEYSGDADVAELVSLIGKAARHRR